VGASDSRVIELDTRRARILDRELAVELEEAKPDLSSVTPDRPERILANRRANLLEALDTADALRKIS
jgi:hypothetical protein